jgi:hypothetical protein
MTIPNPELQINVHLAEYQQREEEILKALEYQQRTFDLSLASAAIAVPIIAGLAKELSPNVAAMIFYLLTIIYASLVMNYVYNGYIMNALGAYIREYITPEVNRILAIDAESSDQLVLQWQSYMTKHRRTFPDGALAGLSAVGSSITLLVPGGVALALATYYSLLPVAPIIQPSLASNFASTAIPLLAILAWVLFSISLAADILVLIYAARTSTRVPNSPKNKK